MGGKVSMCVGGQKSKTFRWLLSGENCEDFGQIRLRGGGVKSCGRLGKPGEPRL